MSAAEAGYDWYLFRDGQQHGPITHDEIHKLVELQRLRPTDLLWREGFADWTELTAITELQPQRPPRPPPAPPMPRAAGPAAGIGPASNEQGVGRAVSSQSATRPVAKHGHAVDTPATMPGGIAPEISTTLPMVAYVMVLVPIFPVPLIGLIIALVNTDAKPDWLATHYRWNWRTVVKSIPMSIVGALLLPVFGLGILVLLGVFVWAVVRIIKGISALNRRAPVANYRTWGWNIDAAR